ncbi:UDP-glycosyltransferase 71C3 [Morus notabilis]|uniref:Glycosyltransferase n=1 Tax=Morus notabilis TaxID=981085 RepID=W9RP62_9ROSA|nr:UDP-glycosyltransferase 71K1 [Morus notabilis]XP_024026730.1 UDP-glycosyltransferase 71K1 [Morus notabilis]XP_024026731.1 UDP-glycosyltransferase 71K1 [Morus notabilis]EXC01454.1 UDP-glycosyltransferase 71C3 [Morus notabilis]
MKRSELVFIPAPGIGHLISTLEFANRLIDRHDRLSVTVLCMKFPIAPYADAYTKSLVGSQSRITLIDLPQVDPPLPERLRSPEHYIYVYIESLNPHVRNALSDIVLSRSNSGSIQVAGLVLDFFCMPMMDVANEFDLPCYMFLTSNLGFLGLMLYIPSRHEQISCEFKDSDPDMILPGFVSPVPANVLPSPVFNKDGGYTAYVKLAQRFRETKGIIVNSFTELESNALNSLADDQTPPIYLVGPVLDLKGQAHPSLDQIQRERIMKWLDEQPPLSVVFLCFGSMGGFGESQLREITSGLERSVHRFVWSIRVPQPKGLEEILPEGFLERIGGKGLICNGWAPQVEVLAHRATGGFVSHCGWNSILESLWYGVPIATWPIYAEQQMNAFRMVREFGLAVELRLDFRNGDLVMADEIETAVTRLMEGDSELRKKVKEMSEMARKAVAEGGSSFTAVGKFVNDIPLVSSCDS